MKKLFAALLLILASLLLTATALADRLYIFPESNVRRLTRQEVEEWDYESLGYAFNEIFARYGYNYSPGGKYYSYFNAQPWYTPLNVPNYSHDAHIYPRVNDVEWENYHLIKEVRAEKKYNDWGRSIWDTWSGGMETMQGFDYIALWGNQELPVYTAPGTGSWRAANGLAEVSTNGAVYAAGVENGWLLVLYETKYGSIRVGYVDTRRIQGPIPAVDVLNFAYDPATVTQSCILTDDPASAGSIIAALRPGASVIWLGRFYNHTSWDYVEVTVNGQKARGFVLAGSLDVDGGATPLESVAADVSHLGLFFGGY